VLQTRNFVKLSVSVGELEIVTLSWHGFEPVTCGLNILGYKQFC